MTDGAGTIKARYDYDPWGNRTKLAGGLDADFAFTGHYYHSPSNLHLSPYRAYDSITARWLCRDQMEELSPDGPNSYNYVHDNPITLWDPLGLKANILVYRTSRTSITTVFVFENGKYLGGFYGNQGGYAEGKQAPASDRYTLQRKSNYELGDKFLSGTPSITKNGFAPGQPEPGARGTHRVHPESQSEGCLTGPLDWANRIWDIMNRNMNDGGTTILYIDTKVIMGLPVGPRLPAPTAHTWPVFGIQGVEPIPTR
jgi:RHS repeat-associated protein